MSSKHILKLADGEAAVKCYLSDATGGIVDISLQTDLTKSSEVYVPGTSKIVIKSIYWGAKANKQIDISRIVSTGPDVLHGHYYFINNGNHIFDRFVDNTYADKDIRITADGPFHCIILFGKSGWNSKFEEHKFGSYDNPNLVGS